MCAVKSLKVIQGKCAEEDKGWRDFQVQLHPHHLPLLAHLGACLTESGKLSAAASAVKEAASQAKAAAGQAPASRSIIEGMLLPDTTAFATEFMTRSWAYGHGDTPEHPEEVIRLELELSCDEQSSLCENIVRQVRCICQVANTARSPLYDSLQGKHCKQDSMLKCLV